MKRTHPNFSEWNWKTYSDQKIYSIEDFVEENKNASFYIGTDSQNHRKRNACVFTSALIAYEMGKGGKILTHSDKLPVIDNLRERLLMEAMRSLEVAWFLHPKIPSEAVVSIHLDVNDNLKFKSGKYKDELVGLIMAQGFEVTHKPNSWAASSVADSRC